MEIIEIIIPESAKVEFLMQMTVKIWHGMLFKITFFIKGLAQVYYLGKAVWMTIQYNIATECIYYKFIQSVLFVIER